MNLSTIHPFNKLSDEGKKLLEERLEYKYFPIGERIYREDELPYEVNLIIKGEARILVKSMVDNSLITIERKGQGSIIGWVGLLRGKACETIQVCKDIEAISIPSEVFVRLCITEQDFSQYFDERVDASETWDTLKE